MICKGFSELMKAISMAILDRYNELMERYLWYGDTIIKDCEKE